LFIVISIVVKMAYKKGYWPWLYVNFYTLLSTLGRLARRDRPEIEFGDSGIYAKGADKLIFFNLVKRFRIEVAEIPVRKEIVRNPFRPEFLMIIVAKAGNRVRVKAIFPASQQ
jgi:hypothetical protein